MVPFTTYTASGNELSSGLTEREARQSAQRDADERGEPVDVYQGSRHIATFKPKRGTSSRHSTRRLPKIGDRVEAGKPGTEDHDCGRVMSVDRKSKIAMVAWDSLVVTPAPFDVLTILKDR